VLGGLTVLLLAAVVARPRFRRWLATLDLRWLVAVHLTRFVGLYFLLLYYRDGALPRAFAVPGGWGDVIVATLAGCSTSSSSSPPRPGWPWPILIR
jgi:hypothetical protein